MSYPWACPFKQRLLFEPRRYYCAAWCPDGMVNAASIAGFTAKHPAAAQDHEQRLSCRTCAAPQHKHLCKCSRRADAQPEYPPPFCCGLPRSTFEHIHGLKVLHATGSTDISRRSTTSRCGNHARHLRKSGPACVARRASQPGNVPGGQCSIRSARDVPVCLRAAPDMQSRWRAGR